MKKFIVSLLTIGTLVATSTNAEIILSAVVKDGPNGYNATGTSTTTSTSSTSVTSSKGCCWLPSSTSTTVNNSSVTTNGIQVSNRVEADLGLRLEYLTKDSPIVISIEGFQDTTVAASIGVRLW